MQNTEQEYKDQIKELEQQIRLLKEQVDFLTRKLYGTKSEKTSTLEIEGQMSLFDDMNLHRLSAACLSEHIVSKITIEASGFSLEGIKRDAIYKNGKYHDLLCYSLLKDEYKKIKEQGGYALIEYVKRVKQLKQKYLSK